VPDGAGYKAKDAFNLFASSDEWNSPVHAEVGPDGAVWIADFQNFIIQHNPTPSKERGGFEAKTGTGGAHENVLRDHERGRIYRVYLKGVQVPTKTLPKEMAVAADWVPRIKSPLQFWRLTAQRMIIENPPRSFVMEFVPGKKTGDGSPLDGIAGIKNKRRSDVVELMNLIASGTGSPAATHALWTLNGLGKLDEATLRAALLSKDAKLRRNAIRALDTDKKAQDLFFGAGVFSDPDLNTRLAAFVKLSDFETTTEIRHLVTKLAADPLVKGDEWLTEAARLLVKKHKAQAFKEGPNLLVNGDLEKIGKDGLPEGWKRRDYGKKPGNEKAEWKIVKGDGNAHGGKSAIRCITRDDADTSFYQDVPLKPNTTYRLSGWVKTHGLRGKVSFNDHIGRAETNKITSRETDWNEIEVVFTNKDKPKASINILHVAKGDGYFDDVKLCEVIPIEDQADMPLAGDVKRGENLFWNHPVAACKNCHVLKGQGSPVGPALDGIAGRKDEAYIIESLVNPNAKLAEGYVATPISPMPPLNLILKPQEFADVKAFILSLKEQLVK
jgi:mono/diheme cytochrome c family protein